MRNVKWLESFTCCYVHYLGSRCTEGHYYTTTCVTGVTQLGMKERLHAAHLSVVGEKRLTRDATQWVWTVHGQCGWRVPSPWQHSTSCSHWTTTQPMWSLLHVYTLHAQQPSDAVSWLDTLYKYPYIHGYFVARIHWARASFSVDWAHSIGP